VSCEVVCLKVTPRVNFPDTGGALSRERGYWDGGASTSERLDKTIAFLKTLTPQQFQGASERTITLPFLPGKALKANDYLVAFALPNFYFHATTAYSILRHNGVDVGKGDFLGEVPFFDVPPSA